MLSYFVYVDVGYLGQKPVCGSGLGAAVVWETGVVGTLGGVGGAGGVGWVGWVCWVCWVADCVGAGYLLLGAELAGGEKFNICGGILAGYLLTSASAGLGAGGVVGVALGNVDGVYLLLTTSTILVGEAIGVAGGAETTTTGATVGRTGFIGSGIGYGFFIG